MIQAQDGYIKHDEEKEVNPDVGSEGRTPKVLSDVYLAAQCFIFFFAGNPDLSDTITVLNRI